MLDVTTGQECSASACYLRRVKLVLNTLFAAFLAAAWLAPAAYAQTQDEIWVLPIDDTISPATVSFVERRIAQANEVQPPAVVLRVNTPGGRVDSMQTIVDVIMNRAQVPVIAVVENAFSAGALIAMAADDLAMLPGSSIGAALPISVAPGGSEAVDEKFNSALRGQFRSVAESRGRNGEVAEAMVDPTRVIPGLVDAEQLVTLSASEAVEYGIADLQANDFGDALVQLGYSSIPTVELERTLTERIAAWFANPIVLGVLFILGIGGLALEFFNPGFGIPGAIGIAALATFAMTVFVATPAGPVDIALLLIGILLLAVEAVILPGFGVAGALGLAAIVAAMVRIFQADALTVLSTSAVAAGVLLGLLLWMLPNTGLGRRLTLSTRIGGGTPADQRPDVTTMADPERAKLIADRSYLVGKQGVANSDLRPSGIATFDGERVDVVSDGRYVEQGASVEVVGVSGVVVTVRPVAFATPSTAPASSEPGDESPPSFKPNPSA